MSHAIKHEFPREKNIFSLEYTLRHYLREKWGEKEKWFWIFPHKSIHVSIKQGSTNQGSIRASEP